ncbi:hypothetical protein ACFVQ9_35565 [Streptomyces goshikiensis]|uniref:hypothetical protein n=1 Tax=Streptomyces goshikiensis TaxID=1942 RepID=UPI0036C6F3F2
MTLCQLSAPPDPGFRLDLDGTARFLHEGYLVRIQVRRAASEDEPHHQPPESDPHDIVMTGTVTLENTDVGVACAFANERDAHSMREALEEVLRHAVEDARRTVTRLISRVEQIDSKHRAQPK